MKKSHGAETQKDLLRLQNAFSKPKTFQSEG